MIKITPQQLLAILPHAGARAALFAEPINEAIAGSTIDTSNELATFIAQCGHESAHLTRLEENLNYSAEGLLATWPSRFTPESAVRYARRPDAIANLVYANRMENGDEASGDGWRFRGRGLLQITGRRNYRLCGEALGIDLLFTPTLLLEPLTAARSAVWFWGVAKLDAQDDDADARAESKLINGGVTGLADRQALLTKAIEVLS